MLAQQHVEETSFSFSSAVPRQPDRRRQERHLTILRVGTLIVDGRRELCLIRNISAGGLLAHVYCGLKPDQPVAVEFRSNQHIQGHVVWVEAANAGIAFDVPIDVADLLANPPALGNGWRPRMPRVEIDRLGTLRVGARTHWIQARDISQGGAKLELDAPLEAGTEVVLTFEGLPAIPGAVRWQSETHIGVSFNTVLPFGELIAWLKRGG